MILAFYIPLPSAKLMLVFLAALCLCAALTRLVLSRQKGIGFDAPDGHRKSHEKVISRLGGLPIFITLLAGLAFAMVNLENFPSDWWPLLLCNTLVFVLGFLDDLKPLGAKWKLLGQIGAAAILYALGESIDIISSPTGHGSISLGWMAPVVTILWLVAIPNIINLIDGMDGLASGFGLFLCVTLAFVGHFSGRADVVMMSAVMAGALAGFLMFNFPPAKIFLGDGGAYLIGFFIASVSLSTSQKGYVVGALFVMIVALGIPILDTLFAILRRAVRGVPLFRADAEHIHHRLILLGYSKGQALAVMYSVCVLLSLAGISVLLSRGLGPVIGASALVLMALVAARYLGYVRSWTTLRQQFNEALRQRRELEFASAYGHVLELEADRMENSTDFSQLLEMSLTRIGFINGPEESASVLRMTLDEGWTWEVNHCGKTTDLRRRRLETLLPGVNRARQRWTVLPGQKIIRTADINSAAPEA
ncbi:MAG: undecaprenyl/decaprenyl-phosphate alpha-N-acetylglucosaminyl 1-phosphate transferase [Verrucomicrobiaceae bacterium]|nr:undecaprenyl/decaprenyl-phosphate alpha-N-acetylglucosaminyl 1-phosphate transferase [Verrucomicrobiaceae bacterium]MDB6120340.1 undecaprenyl/decaprenyl-phosphate alpha-N-acetylglucosaminyl 1-phosphate transferase [Verrucomicrobiaceae bacterium]